jgi:MFS family permease
LRRFQVKTVHFHLANNKADRGYLRPLILSGSFLTVFGMFMLSLSTKYYQVFLTQAFCVGLGQGLTYIPALALISSYFTTRRPIAIGVAAIGSSVGGVVIPIMFRKLQPRIGFGWTVRSIAFINFAFAIVVCFILCRQRLAGGGGNERRSLLDMHALREPMFLLWTASLFFLYLACKFIPLLTCSA